MKKLILKQKNTVKILRDILIIFTITIFLTLALLGLVSFFDIKKIHVIGSREMWIGLIASLLGGAYTLLGVQLTLHYQSKTDAERQRLDNMPILKINSTPKTINEFSKSIYTLNENELLTTAFPANPNKYYPVIDITLANNKSAFDVHINSCITIKHTKDIKKTSNYFPAKHRLVAGEHFKCMFWIQDYEKYDFCNIQGLLRVEYSDIFGNRYYQDIPFCYNEQVINPKEIMTFVEIKSPILATNKTPSLVELLKKEYPEHYETV